MKIKLIDYGYKRKPVRVHYNDAGADVHVCLPDGDKQVRLWGNSSTKVPLGFGLELPDGYAAFIFPRSGLSSQGIACEIPPIDSGYKGEIYAIVTNHTPTDVFLNDGDRIGQLVIMPIVIAEFVEELGKGRNENGFGSSGR